MNRSAIHKCSLVIVMLVSAKAGIAEDNSAPSPQPASLVDRLADSWATVVPSQAAVSLRVLTEEQKQQAERTIAAYRAARGSGGDNEQETASYRKMPSDLRAGNFYKIGGFGSDAIELKNEEIHAIVPLSSVRVVLMGPSGTFAAGGPFDPRSSGRPSGIASQDLIQAIRGGDRGVSTPPRGFAGPSGLGGGLLRASQPRQARDNDQPAARPTVYFLKYASAESLAEVVADIYEDAELRLTIELRLNALIVQGDPNVVKEVEQLVEALDRQSVHDEDESAEEPTLRAYEIEGLDATMLMQVLQTMLAESPDVRIGVDPTNNRVIALGRSADHEVISATIKQLVRKEEVKR